MHQIETNRISILILGLLCAFSFGCAPQVLEQSEALRAKHEKPTVEPSSEPAPESAPGAPTPRPATPAADAIDADERDAEEEIAEEQGRSGEVDPRLYVDPRLIVDRFGVDNDTSPPVRPNVSDTIHAEDENDGPGGDISEDLESLGLEDGGEGGVDGGYEEGAPPVDPSIADATGQQPEVVVGPPASTEQQNAQPQAQVDQTAQGQQAQALEGHQAAERAQVDQGEVAGPPAQTGQDAQSTQQQPEDVVTVPSSASQAQGQQQTQAQAPQPDEQAEQQRAAERERQKRLIELVKAAIANDVETFLKGWDNLSRGDRFRLATDVGVKGNTLLHLVTQISKESRPAGQADDPRIVEELCALSKKVDRFNKRGRTPLHYALQERTQNFEMAKALIACGANVNLEVKSENPLTPLMMIAYFLHVDLFAQAIEKGADLRVRFMKPDNPEQYPHGITLANFASDGLFRAVKDLGADEASMKLLAEKKEAFALIEGHLKSQGISVVAPLTDENELTVTKELSKKSPIFSKADIEAKKVDLDAEKAKLSLESSIAEAKKVAEEDVLKLCKNEGYQRCEGLTSVVSKPVIENRREVDGVEGSVQFVIRVVITGKVKGFLK